MNTAIITGASRGLGRALTLALARDGHHLVIDARDASALEATAKAAEARGGRVTAIAGDITDPGHRAALVAAADGLDLLVNNAGTLGTSPLPRLADQPLDDLEHAFRANTLAPLALIQAALPALRQHHGAVLNITSDAAVESYETWGGYSATKAALEQISRTLLAEEPDVSVWWVDPGEMRTDMLRLAGEDADAAPPPDRAAAALRHLIDARLPGGRYTAGELAR